MHFPSEFDEGLHNSGAPAPETEWNQELSGYDKSHNHVEHAAYDTSFLPLYPQPAPAPTAYMGPHAQVPLPTGYAFDAAVTAPRAPRWQRPLAPALPGMRRMTEPEPKKPKRVPRPKDGVKKHRVKPDIPRPKVIWACVHCK